jgi:redox-sensitive bicupin YhaK (pirin superfamily)
MTAGSGIIHQEKPKGKDDGLVRGFHREELRIAFDEYDKGTFIKHG